MEKSDFLALPLDSKRQLILDTVKCKVLQYKDNNCYWGWHEIYTHYYVDNKTDVNKFVDELLCEDCYANMGFVLLCLKGLGSELIDIFEEYIFWDYFCDAINGVWGGDD